jgi:hypothetical protein
VGKTTPANHEGGASHLPDKVRVDVHIDVSVVNNDGPLVADAKDVSEEFGGRVAPG